MGIDLRLRGKVAVITGGSRGLGAASARLMAAEGAKLSLVALADSELDKFATELRETPRQRTMPRRARLLRMAASMSL